MIIRSLFEHPRVSPALQSLQRDLKKGIELAIAIQQIPAPTFDEGVRARWVANQFRELNLLDVAVDKLHNVFGRQPGTVPTRPPLVISAHTDTVFPTGTDLSVRRNGRRIFGPGLADNSMGVAGLLWLRRILKEYNLQTESDIWFVANVCEEGLGDLRGMRAVAKQFGRGSTYLVVEGGSYGHIIHQGIGVKRFRIAVQAPGGHSWADFGQRSAIHVLGHIISEIDRLAPPRTPKTTFNVGVIEGGTSINTIAESAHLLLDLRSESASALRKLFQQVNEIIQRYDQANDITVRLEKIGDRPAGALPLDHPLVRSAAAALETVGCSQIEFGASSTDANIPLSLGAPAVCIGLCHSGNVHRLNEYLDTTYLPQGMGQLLLLTLAAAGCQLGD